MNKMIIATIGFFVLIFTSSIYAQQGRFALWEGDPNGAVSIDYFTGLLWEKNPHKGATYRNWQDALHDCAILTTAGLQWRLPDIKELRSTVDNRMYDPATDQNWFTTYSYNWNYAWHRYYWSSTTVVESNYGGSKAWEIDFYSGKVVKGAKNSGPYGMVRCVSTPNTQQTVTSP